MDDNATPPQSDAPQSPPPTMTPPPAGPVSDVPPGARTMGMLCHLLGGLVGFLGPLIVWLIKKAEHPFIDEQGKEALNWQLTVLIAWVGLLILNIVLARVAALACVIALVWIALGIGNLVLCILGAVKANAGTAYTYPYTIKFVK